MDKPQTIESGQAILKTQYDDGKDTARRRKLAERINSPEWGKSAKSFASEVTKGFLGKKE